MSDEPSNRRSVYYWSALAGIGAFILAVLGLLGFKGCSTESQSAGPSYTSSAPTPMTTTTTTTTTMTTTTTTTTTPEPSPPPPAPPIPTQVDAIAINVEALQGRKVGPNMFAFDGNLDFGLGYGWTATAGGVEVDGENCQIKMQVTGPESFPAQRTAECTKSVGSPFNWGINSERITTPGDYTITVIDEITGATGVATFTLVS